MPNWIFFDVGSTLVDETEAYQRFAHRCAMTLASHGKPVTGAEFFAKMQEVAALGEAPIRNAWAWYGLPDALRPRWSHEGKPSILPSFKR
ncbi:hypothetical protein [Streptococcus thoraltensis]